MEWGKGEMNRMNEGDGMDGMDGMDGVMGKEGISCSARHSLAAGPRHDSVLDPGEKC